MSEALDLLNSLTDKDIAAYGAGRSEEPHILIDDDRYIIVPESLKRIAVQGDKDIETVTFDCPRYWDSHDLSKMKIYIFYECSDGYNDAPIAKNVRVSSADSYIMHFDWTISENVTKTAGKLKVSVCAKTVDADGNEKEVWNSEPCEDMYVSKGLKAIAKILAENPDILTEVLLLKDNATALHNAAMTRSGVYVGSGEMPEWADVQIDPDGERYFEADTTIVQEKGDDRNTVMSQQAVTDELDKLNDVSSRNSKRITNLEKGLPDESFLTDSEVSYSKTVPQNALPYAEVGSVGGMTRKCTNILKVDDVTYTVCGCTVTVKDGLFTISGTADSSGGRLYVLARIVLSAGTYVFNGNANMFLSNEETNDVITHGHNSIFTVTEETKAIIGHNFVVGTAYSVSFNVWINEGETALPYEPYFEGLRSAPVTEVESVGANLIPFPYVDTTKTADGVVFTVNNDGSVSVSGTPTALNPFVLYNGDLITEKVHTFSSGGTFENVVLTVLLYDKDGSIVFSMRGAPITIDPSKYPTAVREWVVIARDIDNVQCSGTVYPMLNKGSTALPYTPYVRNSLPIPDEVMAIDGYGWGINESVFNYIDWEKKQFVKRVEKQVFTGANNELWRLNQYGDLIWTDSKILYPTNADKVHTLSDRYMSVSQNGRMVTSPLSYIGYYDPNQKLSGIFFRNTGFATISEWKNYLAEQYVNGTPVTSYYELSEPVITDISDILTSDNLIPVEGGGTVTMVNEYGYAVPSEITYMLKGE